MTDEFRAAWLRHSSTKALRKDLKEQHRLANEALLNLAKVSSDPKVAAAHARLHAVLELLAKVEEEDE